MNTTHVYIYMYMIYMIWHITTDSQTSKFLDIYLKIACAFVAKKNFAILNIPNPDKLLKHANSRPNLLFEITH